MKVLHVISGDLWAGAEVQAFTLLSELRKYHDVHVAAAVMNEGDLARRLREHGIDVTVLPESRLSPARLLIALRRLILDFTPDVVHTHRLKENVLGSIANAISLRAPCVRTVHGSPEHQASGLGNLDKRMAQSVDRWCGNVLQQRIVAVSGALASQLQSHFKSTKILVIENGVDVDAIRAAVRTVEFREQHPLATHVGIVGRLVPVKRIDLFLETAHLLQQQDTSRVWRFHVFGDGPLMPHLRTLADSLHLAQISKFHGHREDIISCIAGLDLLVMCSDHEGLPMTLLESLAVGTPVVAHAVGGLINALEHVPTSVLVEKHDKNGYVQAITTALKANPERSGFDLQERFSSTHNCALVKSMYVELLSKR